jgi:hypothetical protein
MQVVLEISGGGMRVDRCAWGDVEFVSKFVGRVDREGRWSTHSSRTELGKQEAKLRPPLPPFLFVQP